MNVRYRVELTQYERQQLGALLSGGKQPARKLKRAQILLAADAGVVDDEIAATVGVGGSTVYRTKRRFVEGNRERALSEDSRPGAERMLTGKEEALLVATDCSNPPAGRVPWTLDLLADEMVKLTAYENLSRETVRRRLASICRDRDQRPRQPMPRPSHRKLRAPGRAGRRLGEAAQCRPRPHHMELHNRKGSRKIGPRISAARHVNPTAKSQNLCAEVIVARPPQIILLAKELCFRFSVC
jgi:transposase